VETFQTQGLRSFGAKGLIMLPEHGDVVYGSSNCVKENVTQIRKRSAEEEGE
jgi:hypothetical protein